MQAPHYEWSFPTREVIDLPVIDAMGLVESIDAPVDAANARKTILAINRDLPYRIISLIDTVVGTHLLSYYISMVSEHATRTRLNMAEVFKFVDRPFDLGDKYSKVHVHIDGNNGELYELRIDYTHYLISIFESLDRSFTQLRSDVGFIMRPNAEHMIVTFFADLVNSFLFSIKEEKIRGAYVNECAVLACFYLSQFVSLRVPLYERMKDIYFCVKGGVVVPWSGPPCSMTTFKSHTVAEFVRDCMRA